MQKKILKINNLKKIYHTPKEEIIAVDNVSFDLEDGEFIAIVGPSGCGKSTILSILCGLEKKSCGKIEIENNKKIGYMLQHDSLFDWRNILNNCLLGVEINKEINEENKEIASNIFLAINKIAKQLGIDQNGFRVITNCGKDAGQEVMHLHFHILAGGKMRPKIV